MMAAQALLAKSQLTTGTAAQHLKSMAAGTTAGGILLAASSLTTGTAAQHLLSAVVNVGVDWRRLLRMRRVTRWRQTYYKLG